ncbi:MAG: hypothetical protein LBH32_12965 [Dysgonamonadaceae bacterium]|nr:hypothetical protein [Dysgonamonadaceae bacterium]
MKNNIIKYTKKIKKSFYSVFNNDAIKDVTLYKGDISASAGGRLSSLMDIRTKDGKPYNGFIILKLRKPANTILCFH